MTEPFLLRVVSIALLSGIVASSRAGELPISKYDQAKNNSSFQPYISGVMSGLFQANIELGNNGIPYLYCMPKNGLSNEQLLEIIDKGVDTLRNDTKYLAMSTDMQQNVSVAFALKRELQERYPCSASSAIQMQPPAPPAYPPTPVYQPTPLPAVPTGPFPNAPGRTTTICRTLSNGTIVCN